MSVPTALPLVTDPRRTIALEGAHNVRDLGGYRIADGRTIAWRRLLRGDGLHGLTAADLAALAPLGLRTVIDLRRHEEIAERGAFPVDRLPVDLVHLPVIDTTWMSVAIPDFSTPTTPMWPSSPSPTPTCWPRAAALRCRHPAPGSPGRAAGDLPLRGRQGPHRDGRPAACRPGRRRRAGRRRLRADRGGHERMRQWYATTTPTSPEADGRDAVDVLRRPPRGDATHARPGAGRPRVVRGYLATLGVDDATLDALADALTE